MRIRFAPSPTGLLHPGGARTALFNYLFARYHGATLVLRIEDTDRARSSAGFERALLEDLRWLGLSFDEGPYHQSARGELYEEAALRLEREGFAYRYEGALYFRPPAREGSFRDELRGEVGFSEVPDFVLMKSDGSPSYNFAVVVDDARMGITHILRGEEHLSNTARQALIYRALGAPEPAFVHLGLILGPDGKKLSKRHGAAPVRQYRDEGYLPQALVNHLALLGWSHSSGREEFDGLDELVAEWAPTRLGASPSVFDPGRLLSINARLIRRTAPGRLWGMLQPFGLRLPPGREIVAIEALQQDMRRLREAPQLLEALLGPVDAKTVAAGLSERELEALERARNAIREARPGTPEEVRILLQGLRGWAKERGIGVRGVLHPLRLALTGAESGPDLACVITVLGYEEALGRVEAVLVRRS